MDCKVVSTLIDLPVDEAFDYAVDSNDLMPGHRVRVNFAGKRVIGIVSSLDRRAPKRDIKKIISLLDEGGRWFSELDLAWLNSLSKDCWVSWGEVVFSALPVELRSGKWQDFPSQEIRPNKRDGEVIEYYEDLPEFRRFVKNTLKEARFRIALWIVESKFRVNELVMRSKREISIPVMGFYQGIGRDRLRQIIRAVNQGPVLIIGTRHLAFWPMVRNEVIFVEGAWLDVYRQEVMPKYDLNSVLTKRVKYSGGKLFLHKVQPDPDSEIIPVQAKEHPLLPAFVEEEFYRVLQNKGHAAVFIIGKGYAKAIRCNACKQVQSCPRCDRPYTLVRERGKDVLYCPSCSNSFPWNGRCLSCGSISVRLSSMGAERWEKILRDRFKMNVPIFEKWLTLEDRFDLVFLIGIDNVVAIDRFYSMPLASRFVAVASHKAKRLYVRTRFTELVDFSGLHERWLSLARELRLPPFGELVILSLRSEDENEVKSKAQRLAKELSSIIEEIPEAVLYGPYLPVERKKRDKFYWNIDLFLPKDLPISARASLRKIILSFRKRYRTITSVLAYS